MRNYLYKFVAQSASVEGLLSALTKADLRGLLEDYGTNLEKRPGGKQRSLQDYRALCERLNAALCVQHHAMRRHGRYTHVNDVCPITLCGILNPVEVVFPDSGHPFVYHVSRYELDGLARYLMSSISFVDINTQRQLTRLQVQKIDAAIHRNNLFFPSLFNLYMTRCSNQVTIPNPQQEMHALLMGLERSVSIEVSVLHDYLFEPGDSGISVEAVRRACSAVVRALNQIKKLDEHWMQIVKSDIVEHLRHAARVNQDDPEGGLRGYIFDSLNSVE